MITKIGIVAGEIWQLLDNNKGGMLIKDIKPKLDRPEILILMSLGWLSREGHVVMEEEGGDFKITLREKETEKAES